MASREDTAADVFSRLGAGKVEPHPGGSIREYSGRVNRKNNCHFDKKKRLKNYKFPKKIGLFSDKIEQSIELYACG